MSDGTEHLRKLRNEFHGSFGAAFFVDEPERATERLNAIHDAFIGKAIELAEKAIGRRTAACAFLLFGSGGRREQMLSSDQDNGIVFEALPGFSIQEANEYASRFGMEVHRQLEMIGYPPCEGKVLGSNPFWRRDIDFWESALRGWAKARDFEAVRNLLITADARLVYGSESLANRFFSGFKSLIHEFDSVILRRMLENSLRYKMLVGVFGNLLTEPYGLDTGGIDIKYGAYIPMVNGVRLLSLRARIRSTSTLERIKQLESSGAISSVTAGDWEAAFKALLALRLMIPSREESGLYTNRGKLPARLLTKEVKTELKQTLRVGAELQKYVKRTFSSEGLL